MKRATRYPFMILSTLLILSLVFSLLSFDKATCFARGLKIMRYYDGNEQLYVNLKSCEDEWWTDNCVQKVYLFGEDTAWVTLNETSEAGIYKAIVPKGNYNKLIICRCENKSSNWDNGGVYNQTGDIQIFENNNYISYFKGENSATVAWSFYYKDGYVPNNYVEDNQNIEDETGITGCNSHRNVSVDSDENLYNGVEGGTILHAFCWSYKTIEANLDAIKAAGYTAVQTSPVQQPKDYDVTYTLLDHQWWKLYQPLSYKVAEKSWLGTRDDLQSLCTSAHSKGIKVICDIVANHLAAQGDKELKKVLHEDIAYYEPDIYNNPDKYIHQYEEFSDHANSVENIVRGNVGMPDVKTSDVDLQNKIKSLLQDLMDIGVDGFRFDAAKHIETEDDGDELSSNFWENITNYIKDPNNNHGKDIYVYGEILSPMMAGRQYSSYTKYMNIIDNRSGDIVLNAVHEQNAGLTAVPNYPTGEDANMLVTWAESHDTYMGESQSSGGIQSSSEATQEEVNKAWAIVSSRADTTNLYFPRVKNRKTSPMDSVETFSWKSIEVSSINYFHRRFHGYKEYLSYSGNIFMNERYLDSEVKQGAVLVNLGRHNSLSINNLKVNTLNDGRYIDSITGNFFTVKNGHISGNIGDTGIAVLYTYIER